MAARPRLFHVGAVIADVVLDVDALPEPGGDVFATASRTLPGGGFNVMAAAARAGMPVVYGGAHGTGPYGDMAREALRAEGVAVAHPPKPGTDTGFCVALVDSSAERTFVTSLGAEGELTLDELRALRPAPGDFVYAVGYALMSGPRTGDLLAWIGGLPEGVRLVFDPAPVVGEIGGEALAAVLGRTDVLSLNAREAAITTGTADTGRAAALLAGRIRGGGTVVLRDAADGCLVAGAGAEPVRVPGFPVRAVDTNGAGDAHVGVFTAALAAGLDPVRAARRANAAAAIAVTRRGPATAPDAAELDRFLVGRATPAL
ncbi:PfkB family carbohydrate kinase [Nocardiopsis composta]|uniref:Sugar/nucleoside kinase (Ribokinase family) n=1 Tax=Nocardiopsis composta TaxID=157465 RepID=A0A7W8QMM4_9ACTN|nr:PfkB family carbohydrate kinase [Nocardiopsis composta]MBB5433243.1 sugar/nucleoside kinase (ribokinase family) [Nocardiopsis composta]